MAQNLLFNLKERIQEIIPLLNDFEKEFYLLAIKQLLAMQRTIIHDKKFFETYFLNKTYEEVYDWIDKESKKW